MDSLSYTGSTGEVVAFDLRDPIRLGEGDTLRSHEWDYELGYRGLTDVTLPAHVEELEVLTTRATADAMRRTFDRDMDSNAPGTVDLNGWSQRALVVSWETEEWYGDVVLSTIEMALLDGFWRRPSTMEFLPDDAPVGSEVGKGYPYGYPYGYGTVHAPTSVRVPGYVPAEVKLTIYGPATSPSVTIGGNLYSCSADVPAGGYLVVDGVNRTATMTSQGGATTNYLPYMSLGTGEGSGEYAFEPLRPGDNPLVWSGAFGFSLTMYERSTQPDFEEA